MATEVEIVNLALSRLGSSVTVSAISPPDGSKYAAHAASMYPFARNTALEAATWPFSTKRKALAELSGVTPPAPYIYTYLMPSDAVVPIDIRSEGESDNAPPGLLMWELRQDGSRVVYSDKASAIMRYKVAITDTTRFTPMFVDAVAWLLAANMVGVVLGGDIKQFERCYAAYLRTLGMASNSIALGLNAPVEHVPGWVGSR